MEWIAHGAGSGINRLECFPPMRMHKGVQTQSPQPCRDACGQVGTGCGPRAGMMPLAHGTERARAGGSTPPLAGSGKGAHQGDVSPISSEKVRFARGGRPQAVFA